MSQSWPIFASTPLSNTHRQILPAVGQRSAIWTRAIVDKDNDLFIPDAPPCIDTVLRRAASTLSPMVDLAANGLRGIKRAADLVIFSPLHKAKKACHEATDKAAGIYTSSSPLIRMIGAVELRMDDGLVIKRFKRLPIDAKKATVPTALYDTLPARELQQLYQAKEFGWTADPLTYLGPENHESLRQWLWNIRHEIEARHFAFFDDKTEYHLDVDLIPLWTENEMKAKDQLPWLSIFMHNHMLDCPPKTVPEEIDRMELFEVTARNLLEKVSQLLDTHEQTYHNLGHIPELDYFRIKPIVRPVQMPYEEMRRNPVKERNNLRQCALFLQYLLRSRKNFDRTFPQATFAGMLADIDAIRKEELPPSYVEWPGKYKLPKQGACPGTYPGVNAEQHIAANTDSKFFETIRFADFTVDSKWDHMHPSPTKKKIQPEDHRTPVQKAMKKNELIKDKNGDLQAKKAALKKTPTDWKAIEDRCVNEITEDAAQRLDIDMDATPHGRIAFIQSPVAFYMHSNNTPVKRANSKLKSKYLTFDTPPLTRMLDRTADVKPKAPSTPHPQNKNRTAAPNPPSTPYPRRLEVTEHIATAAPTEAVEPTGMANPADVVEPAKVVAPAEDSESAPENVPEAVQSTEIIEPTEAIEPTVVVELARESIENDESDESDESDEIVERVRSRYCPRNAGKTLDELLDDEEGPFGKQTFFKISEEKEDDIALRAQLQEDAQFQIQQQRSAEVRRKLEEEREAIEAERKAKEEERKKAEEERQRLEREARIAEQMRFREEDERIAQAGQLRQAHMHIIANLTEEWVQKAHATMGARGSAELAKTPEGTPLSRKDFATVVPPNQWLNDEIINGTLSHLKDYINQSAGIKNIRVQTPKAQLFNSFTGAKLAAGNYPNARTFGRFGVKKETFFDIETILLPICESSHWTLVVIRPKHRQVCHLDSMRPRGQPKFKDNALAFVRAAIGSDFHENEWTVMNVTSPQQCNSDDCGVHTITNGICMGLGIDPSTAYNKNDISLQRLRVASVLLNGGFKGDFTLDGF